MRVRGAREHNLKDVDLDIPRDALVVFTGISGSGKSSLAFGTIYAEAQRRYFESVAPYARRLIDQVGVPDVDAIDGLPPAVALQQHRGAGGARSSVGSVTTLSSLLRMLYSRAGRYPRGAPMLYAEDFSPNTPQGACPRCHGLGVVHEVTEQAMVPDPTRSIRERAIAAWPPAWQGQNLRDILVTLGHDVDAPWKSLPKKARDWILYTDEQPTVPVYAGFTPAETRTALRRKTEPSYMGTFMGARHYVLHTYAHSQSERMRRRVSRFLSTADCPDCRGSGLKPAAMAVRFAGLDIGAMGRLSLAALRGRLAPAAHGTLDDAHAGEEQREAARRMAGELVERIGGLEALGLGYLSLDRRTPTLSPGELQRLRLATQLRSQLFGVVYVLDEPTAGLHPADGEALLDALAGLRDAGNSVFVVEHDLATMRRADWLVDVGPGAGEGGGRVLYGGPPSGLAEVAASETARYLFGDRAGPPPARARRAPTRWLRLRDLRLHNLRGLDADLPLGVLCAVTGVSGSGKSSLVSQALVELLCEHLGREQAEEEDEAPMSLAEPRLQVRASGRVADGLDVVTRLVRVDQKPIGRTPRSNLATYTGLFDPVRALFAATPAARKRKFDAGRFSFNVAKGRCPRCEGEGFVMVELLFLPSVFAPCPVCHGARYNPQTLAVTWNGKNIAEVLALSVDVARAFFADQPAIRRPLDFLHAIGLGYLRLGQPATELSGGEAQRIKLASELQRTARGHTLYLLDEPGTGLHPADMDRLLTQLLALVDAGHSVLLVEHDPRVVAQCDWVIDLGPGAGDEGGRIVAAGTPDAVAAARGSRTGVYLKDYLR